jgi:hypothetical protein
MEVLACSVLPGFLCIIPVAAMFLTNQWMWAITGIVVLPSFAIVISASVFLVTLLFPDIDDPAQRGIRGIISLLGMVMALAPGILVLVLCAFLNWLPVGSILPAAINLAISFGICMIGGQMYANFNPTD